MPNTNGHGPKRAILYARVSTDEQARSGYSISDQLKELRGHAVREGYQVVEEIEDEGYSGGDPYRLGSAKGHAASRDGRTTSSTVRGFPRKRE